MTNRIGFDSLTGSAAPAPPPRDLVLQLVDEAAAAEQHDDDHHHDGSARDPASSVARDLSPSHFVACLALKLQVEDSE